MALSSIRPKLLPIKLFHCVNREFAPIYCEKMVENIKIFRSCRKIDADDTEHIFWLTIDCFTMYVTVVTRIQGVSRRIGGVVTSGHVTKMAVTPFVP